MNELYKLVLELEHQLDKEQIIINLKKSYIDLKKDEKLIKEIEKYNTNKDDILRKKIIKVLVKVLNFYYKL